MEYFCYLQAKYFIHLKAAYFSHLQAKCFSHSQIKYLGHLQVKYFSHSQVKYCSHLQIEYLADGWQKIRAMCKGYGSGQFYPARITWKVRGSKPPVVVSSHTFNINPFTAQLVNFPGLKVPTCLQTEYFSGPVTIYFHYCVFKKNFFLNPFKC